MSQEFVGVNGKSGMEGSTMKQLIQLIFTVYHPYKLVDFKYDTLLMVSITFILTSLFSI